MHTFLTVLHVAVGLFLILVILLQAGKGAAMGASLGSAGSQAMFGSSGAGNFLTKLTTVAAIIFMVTSLSLSVLISKGDQDSVITEVEETTEQVPPAGKEELPIE
ncbi:MAG: preprotein translocase subunit SecG [Nitrospinaceae bacterium]